MAAYNKHNQFVEDAFFAVHDLETDQLEIALCAAASAPVAANSVLADLTQISYTNLSARTLTTSSAGQTSGTFKIVVADKTLTASGAVATFRYVEVFNQTPTTPADPLIAWYDHGSDVTLAASETFNVDFDDSNGLFQAA